MKNKILKSLFGVSLMAIMAITFINKSNESTSDIFLDNLIALNTANAEPGGGIKCKSTAGQCYVLIYDDGSILIKLGKRDTTQQI